MCAQHPIPQTWYAFGRALYAISADSVRQWAVYRPKQPNKPDRRVQGK